MSKTPITAPAESSAATESTGAATTRATTGAVPPLAEPTKGGSFVRQPDGALAPNPDQAEFQDQMHRRKQSTTTKAKA